MASESAGKAFAGMSTDGAGPSANDIARPSTDVAGPSDVAETYAITDTIRLSPPPLHVIKKATTEERGKKRKSTEEHKLTTPKSSQKVTTIPSKLDGFHHDTLTVLKDICNTLKQIADTQDRMCHIFEKKFG